MSFELALLLLLVLPAILVDDLDVLVSTAVHQYYHVISFVA